jgi:uncharacterized protein (TIGR00290 family)
MSRAVVLWTGGKDSCLALQKAAEGGVQVVCLATFVPDDQREFKAHPQRIMKLQSLELALPLVFHEVVGDFRQAYVRGLCRIKEEFEVDSVVTGDIDFVDGYPSWIDECCKEAELQLIRPLWQLDRKEILNELLMRGFDVEISWVNSKTLGSAWVGKRISRESVEELLALSKDESFDLCGENGEYHTIVFNCPMFNRPICRELPVP